MPAPCLPAGRLAHTPCSKHAASAASIMTKAASGEIASEMELLARGALSIERIPVEQGPGAYVFAAATKWGRRECLSAEAEAEARVFAPPKCERSPAARSTLRPGAKAT
ncbi:MAG: hypothetical protein Q8O22_02130 [Candidatus Omnitrophota bacterium]|nr:hypothetical protein [Candidatus Omnitrophota bacterium]